jgi:hypothetical protein
MFVEVEELTLAIRTLNSVLSFAGTSKLVPVIETAAPVTPIVGENKLIVGTPFDDVTVKAELLVADPAGAVTLIEPVVAPLGTVAMSCVDAAEVRTAGLPLKLTVS